MNAAIRYKRLRGGLPGGRCDAYAVLIEGRRVGRVWKAQTWVAAVDGGLYPHWYKARTRASAVEQMLTCERP
jgi:hypothetical protein